MIPEEKVKATEEEILKEFIDKLDEITKHLKLFKGSRELSLAITKFEEGIMWAERSLKK